MPMKSKKNYPKEFELWHNRPEQIQMPGGESLADVRKRVRAAFDDYAAIYQGKTLLVAAHDAVNKVILCDLMGLGMEHFWHFKQDNACINVIEEHEKKLEACHIKRHDPFRISLFKY